MDNVEEHFIQDDRGQTFSGLDSEVLDFLECRVVATLVLNLGPADGGSGWRTWDEDGNSPTPPNGRRNGWSRSNEFGLKLSQLLLVSQEESLRPEETHAPSQTAYRHTTHYCHDTLLPPR